MTALGKALRKMRVDRDETLRSMADKLNITASYLSAIEHGKRKIPEDFVSKIIEAYNLDKDMQNELETAYQESVSSIRIDITVDDSKRRVFAFFVSKYIDDIDEESLDMMLDIFRKKAGL